MFESNHETTVLEKNDSVDDSNTKKSDHSLVKKSSKAYRTISEVATELDLPQHVLRFWESKFKQVEPMKRGGGRRYYAPKDVDTLKKIHFLLYTKGYTIKGAKKLLSSRKNISSELIGIEKIFDLFDPITVERVQESAQVKTDSLPQKGTASPAQLSNETRQTLKQVLLDLKKLRELVS